MDISAAGLYTVSEMPCSSWVLDGPSPFYDYSGHGRVATAPTATPHPALVSGATKAIVVGNASQLSSSCNVYGTGHERLPFSVEVAFRSIKTDWSNTAPQQVWGHAGEGDGITIAGTVVSFATKYASTGIAKCSFDIGFNRAVVVAGVHTATKNSLYIDGELAAEVDITPEQQADNYAVGGYTFASGGTSGPNKLALNCLSTYRYALTPPTIRKHFEDMRSGMDYDEVVVRQNGSLLSVVVESANPEETVVYNSNDTFRNAYFSNVSVADNEIVPQSEDSPGYWETAVVLPRYLTSIYGVSLSWEGVGVKVNTSLDGERWSEAKHAVMVESVPPGTNPSDKLLLVRVAFPAGSNPDEAYLQTLTVNIFGSGELLPLDGREVTVSGASIEERHNLKSYHENWGLELSGGRLEIAAPEAGARPIKTIEVWAKKRDSRTFTDNLYGATPTTALSNGTTLLSYQPDEWQLRTYVFNNGFNGALQFTGHGQIGAVAVYDYAMTTGQISASYRRYMNNDAKRLASSGIIGLNDLTNYVEIYEYEWEVVEAE